MLWLGVNIAAGWLLFYGFVVHTLSLTGSGEWWGGGVTGQLFAMALAILSLFLVKQRSGTLSNQAFAVYWIGVTLFAASLLPPLFAMNGIGGGNQEDRLLSGLIFGIFIVFLSVFALWPQLQRRSMS